MASIPNASLELLDGALGGAGNTSTGIVANLGVSSSGPINTPKSFTSRGDVVATFGSGPMVEKACLNIAKAGETVCMRVNSDVPGVAAAPVKSDGATSTAALAVAGTPKDGYELVVKLTQGGANIAAGTAAFQFSLDAGRSWSPERAIPGSGSYVVPGSGLTLNFANGGAGVSFVAGDSWKVACTAPGFSLSELMTSVDALLANSVEWFLLHVVGAAATPAAAAGVFAALGLKLDEAEGRFIYRRAIIEVPEDTDDNIKAAFNNIFHRRVAAAVGSCTIVSAVSDGRQYTRNAAWAAATWAAKRHPHESLGKVMLGPLDFVTSISRDEEKTPGMDKEGFITLRTHAGYTGGHYLTDGVVRAPEDSDYRALSNCRVMDIAARAVRRGQVFWLQADLETDPTTGHLTEGQAKAVENYIEDLLSRDLIRTTPPRAVRVRVSVSRTEPTLTSKRMPIEYGITPKVNVREIIGRIGFDAPTE